MKKWTNPALVAINVSDTANGKNTNKYEGIDGVDANGEYNSYINKNGTGTFTVPTTETDNGEDIVNERS